MEKFEFFKSRKICHPKCRACKYIPNTWGNHEESFSFYVGNDIHACEVHRKGLCDICGEAYIPGSEFWKRGDISRVVLVCDHHYDMEKSIEDDDNNIRQAIREKLGFELLNCDHSACNELAEVEYGGHFVCDFHLGHVIDLYVR